VHLRTQAHTTPLKFEREFFLAHRIDKETSGILVLAKDREVCSDLVRQFAARTTSKTYLAIVRGITPEQFTVDQPLKRQTNSKILLKMITAPESEGGYPSFTEFKRIETSGNFSLLECYPKTGRQHQIRVHLDFAGHPIVGDKLYGMPEEEAVLFYERARLTPEAEAKLLLPRHALHAAGLEFDHPITGQRLKFKCELPEDLKAFLAAPPTGPRAHSLERLRLLQS
jgi:23S rRNA pseudouridine1911/1915/1917 synthase